MAKQLKCTTDNCGGEVYALDLCRNCYQRAWYWCQKSLRERADHLKKLGIRRASLKDLMSLVPVGRNSQKSRRN